MIDVYYLVFLLCPIDSDICSINAAIIRLKGSFMGIRRVTDPSKAINKLYSEGRIFPGRKSPVPKSKPQGGTYGLQTNYEKPRDETRPQDPESGPSDPNFNDAKKNWTRGYGLPPHFDPGGSGNRRS